MDPSHAQSIHHCVTEGNARAPFHTWVSLHNPVTTADVLLRVAPGATWPTSIRVVCDDDAPIVVERATDPRELGPGAPSACIGVPATRLR